MGRAADFQSAGCFPRTGPTPWGSKPYIFTHIRPVSPHVMADTVALHAIPPRCPGPRLALDAISEALRRLERG